MVAWNLPVTGVDVDGERCGKKAICDVTVVTKRKIWLIIKSSSAGSKCDWHL